MPVPMGWPSRLGVGLLLLLLAASASASWTEANRRIITLDEALTRLGPDWSSDLPGELPVLLPAGLEPGDPKALDLALALSGFATGSRPDRRHITLPSFSEEQGARRRRLSIFPVTPRRDEGAIDGGGLLAYGQFVEGPYRVEQDGEEIRINNVRVFPSPGIEVPLPTVTPEQAAHQGLVDAAWRRYDENRLFHDERSARVAFRAECETWPDTESTRWINDELMLQVRSDGEEVYFGFGDRGREPDADPYSARQEMLRVMAEGLVQALKSGHTVVAGASYLFTYSGGSLQSLRARAEEIRGGGESDLLKLARLQARLGRREAAADLLYAR